MIEGTARLHAQQRAWIAQVIMLAHPGLRCSGFGAIKYQKGTLPHDIACKCFRLIGGAFVSCPSLRCVTGHCANVFELEFLFEDH